MIKAIPTKDTLSTNTDLTWRDTKGETDLISLNPWQDILGL
jgi:hypothetical protein